MKFVMCVAALFAALSTAALAQPSQPQGGGQTGPANDGKRDSVPRVTSGTGAPQIAAGQSGTSGAAQVTGDPNGTAGGPTTPSGTGPSTYGGNNPGAAR